MPEKPHGSNLRRGRYSEPNRLYLLTATLLQRRPLFCDFKLARLLITELRTAHDQQQVTSLAWVVMPDHLHWLVQLQTGSLEQLMRRIKSNSARQINQHLGTQGQFGSRVTTTARCAKMKTCNRRLVISSPIRCGLAW